jgi:hypothetical protein
VIVAARPKVAFEGSERGPLADNAGIDAKEQHRNVPGAPPLPAGPQAGIQKSRAGEPALLADPSGPE